MTREITASKKQDWATPRWLFDVLHAESRFTIDLCASPYNACLPRYFGPGGLHEDGLQAPWAGERGFGNPPYEDIEPWLQRALMQCAEGAFSQWLVPANTDTKWFHKYAVLGQIDFFQGRLSFEDLTPPEVELKRIAALYRDKPGENLLRKMAQLFVEMTGSEVYSHESRIIQLMRAGHKPHDLIYYASAELKNFTGFNKLDARKPGPGFPSMLITFDPEASAGPRTYRTRSAKTGELL